MSPPKLSPAREKELLDELRPLIDQALAEFNPGRKRRALTPATTLASLGLDSLAFVGLMGDVEGHLKATFSDAALTAKTVREFLAYAQEAVAARGRKKPGKKPASRKPPTKKKPTARKPPARKPPTKKAAAKKPASRKPPTKKKPTARKPPARKPPTKKAPAKKPATKKPAAHNARRR